MEEGDLLVLMETVSVSFAFPPLFNNRIKVRFFLFLYHFMRV